MDSVKYKANEAVRFYHLGQEYSGIVNTHLRVSGWVLLRSNDGNFDWNTLQAIREGQVWRPGETAPTPQAPQVRTQFFDPGGLTDEVTAS